MSCWYAIKSPCLSRLNEIAVMPAAGQSYRKAKETIKTALGVSISHGTIHQDVQVVGKHLKRWDGETGLDSTGTRVVPLLTVEVDGVILKTPAPAQKK